MKKMSTIAAIAMFALLAVFSGCKPYDTPEYEEIKPNETAFVIPLEGDTGKQVKFDSAEQLEKFKVAAKRIQITHRWNKTGRLWLSGEWIDNVKVIKVDRTPITREWTADTESGTSRKDEGIWAESRDSVGFSTGITITAMVLEEDTATFLYRYQSQQLSQVMDTEIRGRVQASFSDIAGGSDMSELRAQKSEILAFIRDDIMPFFKERGITITTVGQFGGFAYENEEVQKAIDNVFIAQREKEVNAAKLAAQTDANKRLKMEGTGEADKMREIAQGEADAAKIAAAGEAEAIRLVAKAAEEASGSSVFMDLKRLAVQETQIGKWDGKFPSYYMSSGSGSPSLLLQIPSPEQKQN